MVVLGIFIERPTPFLSEFLRRVAELNYPKNRMYLYLHNSQSYHDKDVASFVEKYENDYEGSELILPGVKAVNERKARDDAM